MNTSTRVEFGLYDVTARSDSTPTTEQANYSRQNIKGSKGLGRCHKPSSPVNISAVIECKLSLCKDDQPYHDCCKPSNPEYFGTVEFLALRPKQIFHHFLHLTFSEPMPHSPIQPKQQPIHQYTEMRLEYLMADRIQHPEYHT